jgi:hypothetical protein
LLLNGPLLSVAVTLISHEVSADASPVVGMVNDPGPSSQESDERVEVGLTVDGRPVSTPRTFAEVDNDPGGRYQPHRDLRVASDHERT